MNVFYMLAGWFAVALSALPVAIALGKTAAIGDGMIVDETSSATKKRQAEKRGQFRRGLVSLR